MQENVHTQFIVINVYVIEQYFLQYDCNKEMQHTYSRVYDIINCSSGKNLDCYNQIC
jgi:hypothetical protein